MTYKYDRRRQYGLEQCTCSSVQALESRATCQRSSKTVQHVFETRSALVDWFKRDVTFSVGGHFYFSTIASQKRQGANIINTGELFNLCLNYNERSNEAVTYPLTSSDSLIKQILCINSAQRTVSVTVRVPLLCYQHDAVYCIV